MTRTLADMTPAERDACVGRWAKVRGHLVIIAEIHERSGDAYVFRVETSNSEWHRMPGVTPRLDLPRAWTPSGEPPAGEWDDDQGKNLMRRWVSDWEWKHDTPQHIRDEHERKA